MEGMGQVSRHCEADRALIPKAFVQVIEEQTEKCSCQHMSTLILSGYFAGPGSNTHIPEALQTKEKQ